MTWILLLLFVITKCNGNHLENVTVGHTLDVLKTYGVIGRLVREGNTVSKTAILYNVFKDNLCLNTESPDSYAEINVNNGNWTIKYYEDRATLLYDFFRNYNIEFVDCSLCALAPNLGVRKLATFLGIKDTILAKHNAFMVVKYEKPIFRCGIKENRLENLKLDSALIDKFKNLTQDLSDQTQILNFISSYGSHFISSLTTGEIIYQVFAFPRTLAMFHKQESKNEDDLKSRLLENCMSSSEAGEIRTLSGNSELEELLNFELRDNNSRNKSSNLLRLYKGGINVSQYSYFLKYSAILQFNLTSISNVIVNNDKQLANHFKEILDNQIKLRELYLR